MQYLSAPVGRMQPVGRTQLSDPASRPTAEFRLSRPNDQKLVELHSVVDALLRKMLVRGFHGEAMVKFIVHDGMIQRIEECVTRKHR
jgi:hypothetical protein